jgi:ABC-type dipeptide/oligopeptide/nickel transport system permease subunit
MSEPFSLKRRLVLAASASVLLVALASVLAPLSPEWRAYAQGLEFAVLAGLSILAVASAIAVPLGMLAASGPRSFDTVLHFVCDLVSSLPTVFVAAVFWAWSSRTLGYVCALGTLRGLEQAWLLRCEILRLEADDPESVPQGLGRTPLMAFLRQRLARALGPLFVSASFSVAWLTALDAALTQAGLRPQRALVTWGLVLGSPAARSNPLPAVLAAGSVVLITVALHALFRRPTQDRGLAPGLRPTP